MPDDKSHPTSPPPDKLGKKSLDGLDKLRSLHGLDVLRPQPTPPSEQPPPKDSEPKKN